MQSESSSPPQDTEVAKLVKDEIERLRPRLLDLTARNPLIRTRLSSSSASFIRVVDELPDVLFSRLNGDQVMTFSALPPLEDEPGDERTSQFAEAFAAAQSTDEEFLAGMRALDANAADFLDAARNLDRVLKDRVRTGLGLPPRPTGKDIASLVAHARSHGISPNYDLPEVSEDDGKDKHDDDLIQTLQLPRDMDRRLNSIIAKERTWRQETGVNVLQAAFGFLEWSDPNGRDNNFSPLVILPVAVKGRKTPKGMEFSITGTGDPPDINGVLDERLRRDYGLSLPTYGGGSIEDYLASIGDLDVKITHWRVRRQVVFGIFPSSRIAMYHDLDTTTGRFAENVLVRSVVAGVEPSGISPFAEDYDVDEADRAGRTPLTVLDADSSQISTLLDISDGKNLAVEGPPGTGKSQTIVNAIAAALADGRKVLFVAEKLAALDVVKSRLEAIGLGEFILPLQAGRSSREDVVKSLRERLELGQIQPPGIRVRQEQLRETRERLSTYISILKSRHRETGRTVHAVLGHAIRTGNAIDRFPTSAANPDVLPERSYDEADLRKISDAIGDLDKARAAVATVPRHWKSLQRSRLTPLDFSEILDLASSLAHEIATLRHFVASLSELGVPIDDKLDNLAEIVPILSDFVDQVPVEKQRRYGRLLDPDNSATVSRIAKAATEIESLTTELRTVLQKPTNTDQIASLKRLATLCAGADLDAIDTDGLSDRVARAEASLDVVNRVIADITAFAEYCSDAARWTLRTFHRAGSFIRSIDPAVLQIRSGAFRDPSALAAAVVLIEQGRRLADERETLLDRFLIDRELRAASVREDVAILKNAGTFAALSSQFRRAKKRYLALSRTPGFENNLAISELQKIAAHLEATEAYLGEPRCAQLFGLVFAGLGTDFDRLDKLIAYLKAVDEQFSGPAMAQVRELLKFGDLDLLQAIPETANVAEDVTAAELRQFAEDQSGWIKRAKGSIDEIRTLSSALIVPTGMTVNELREAHERLASLKHKWDALQADAQSCGLDVASPDQSAALGKTIRPWANLSESIGGELLAPLGRSATAGRLVDVAECLKETESRRDRLKDTFGRLARKVGFTGNAKLRNLEAFETWASAAAGDLDGLQAHARLVNARADCQKAGFLSIVDAIVAYEPDIEETGPVIEAIIARHLARQAYGEHSDDFSRFSGESLGQLRDDLKKLDVEITELSREKLRARLSTEASPPYGIGVGRKSDYTEMALVFNEVDKKKRFIPVRDLMRRAQNAILELKPCWMMSPQALAQFVRKDSVEFDLCIIDEASQMPPEDAIGALYRSRQCVIVGDTNQLPPTDFFKRMIDDSGDDDDDGNVLQESILELAKQTFRPARRLRWHYRSRHSGLIGFSNRLIYDDDLIVFPSPDETRADMGVTLVRTRGPYKKGLNADEATTVIEAAVDHMRLHPDRSLGIVALNKQQADYMQELFDNEALPTNRACLDYVEIWREANDGLETFFIKNLENVQGDERDVIFISTVYGPETPGGPVMQRFGPINGLAGQRRLNVLFTRAKEQIVTFSSMTAADITATVNGNKGAWMLKRWLEYSATGVLEGGVKSGRVPDSDFERFVIEQVAAMGCEPVPQVGVSGYFIDIGVRHPRWPHGFLLGIECDGASYHSGKSARDRDRLRQEVLESLSWKLHRIWSTDWFANPRREAEILRDVISTRLDELINAETGSSAFAPLQKSSLDRRVTDGGGEPPAESSPVEDANDGSGDLTEANVEEASSEKKVPEVDLDAQRRAGRSKRIEIGDTVRVRYLTHGEDRIQVTISREGNDQEHGKIGYAMPLAEALLDAEEGEEVEILKGSYLRKALIEKVIKADT